MPDWSYRTVLRPLLFPLPVELARIATLGFMGTLARLPLGSVVIDFLGHMRPDVRLATRLGELKFSSPVGLGPHLDTKLMATAALARFGVGFVEVGPVAMNVAAPTVAIIRHPQDGAFSFADGATSIDVATAEACLRRAQPLPVPAIVRLAGKTSAEWTALAARLVPFAAAFSLELTADQHEQLPQLIEQLRPAALDKPLLLVLPADMKLEVAIASVHRALAAGCAGVLVDGKLRDAAGSWIVGQPAAAAAREFVRQLRQQCGGELAIIASGGVHDPAAALDLFAAGANLVQVDTGLAFAGPGLPKRINEALLFAQQKSQPSLVTNEPPRPITEMSWFWTLLLGIAMFLGGGLALVIAATRVILPYDEAFLDMTREQIVAINPRLLHFMAHDRVTLAGTMIAIGILYLLLSLYGIRRGDRGARRALLASAFAGFGSFFLFLGFGYFDPFHAFVTAIMFQLLLLGLQGRLDPPHVLPYPNLRDDLPWRLSQWGQLLLIAQGAALITAGTIICAVGSTSVFVHEDLEFMQTTVETLRTANPRLVPVVAHDRACFGGMLISCGLATLLPGLWCFRQGERWLWWMLLAAGTTAYTATLTVHLTVGYTNLMHLTPAFAGLGLLWLALALSYPYLCRPDAQHLADWRKYYSG